MLLRSIRISRTVPFLSKVTNIPMAQVGPSFHSWSKRLSELGYQDGLYPESTSSSYQSTSIPPY